MLTALEPVGIRLGVPQKIDKTRQRSGPPRIRVPHQQRAIFIVDNQKFVGIIQRLSLTGGSALRLKGPIPQGTLAEIAFATVFGKVKANIEFLHTGADGVRLAQAFAFLAMDFREQQTLQNGYRRNAQYKLFRRCSETNSYPRGVRNIAGEPPPAFGDAHFWTATDTETLTRRSFR